MDVPHSFLVVTSFVLTRCDHMSIRHLLSIPGFHRYVTDASFYSSCCCFLPSLCHSDSLSLSLCIDSRLPVKVLSIIALTLSRHSLLWFCRSSMQCQRCTSCTTSSVAMSLDVSRQQVEPSRLRLWNSFKCNPRQRGLRQFQLRHLPRSATSLHPMNQSNGCLVQLLPRTTPLPVIHKTAQVPS